MQNWLKNIKVHEQDKLSLKNTTHFNDNQIRNQRVQHHLLNEVFIIYF